MDKRQESNFLLFTWSLLFLFLPLQIPLLDLKNKFLYSFWQSIFTRFTPNKILVFSDSIGFVWLLTFLLAISGLLYFAFRKLIRLNHDANHNYLRYFLLICLFLVYVKYGLDKIMLLQFPKPEPNLMFTPLGELDKDILFWTSMGTSRLYNWITGSVEVLAALFLLFHRTRRFGLMTLLVSSIYILLLNFSFNIGVKFFSLMLVATLLTLNWSTLIFLFTYFFSFGEEKDRPRAKRIYLPILKVILAGSLIAFFIQLNNENKIQNPMQGAYKNTRSGKINYIFINQQNYWIERQENGESRSFEILHQGNKAFSLLSEIGEKREIEFFNSNASTLILKEGTQIADTFQHLNLSKMNVLKDECTLIVR